MTELSLDPAELSADHAESTAFAGESDPAPTPTRIHGNSEPMRVSRRLRAELLAHLGNRPSAVQAAIIDQIAELKLRIAIMDQDFRRTGRRSAHATGDYLAWSGGFVRLLRQLGLKAAAPSGPTLAEVLANAPPARVRPAPAPSPARTSPPAPQPASTPSEATA